MTHVNILFILLTTTLFVLLFPLVPATIDKELHAAEKDKRLIKVRKDGSGDFKMVTDAIENILSGNTRSTIIWIGPGRYKEKILISGITEATVYVALVVSWKRSDLHYLSRGAVTGVVLFLATVPKLPSLAAIFRRSNCPFLLLKLPPVLTASCLRC
ncbi:hypothetical protein GIB67_031528 [Kingdonia uniflora]|uniref:Pectinesterase n=1 Tax=Kingdonia uniflora TaxID=39325 RepID=A0A7J7MNL2_9MAGN|nr:hypothetical protein GIB67_031528 [Kingdonia uniflora]